MDLESQVLDIQIHRRDKYLCTACGRRVSWRSLRVFSFVFLCLLVLTFVVWRAVARKQDFATTLVDIVVSLVALLAPLP